MGADRDTYTTGMHWTRWARLAVASVAAGALAALGDPIGSMLFAAFAVYDSIVLHRTQRRGDDR